MFNAWCNLSSHLGSINFSVDKFCQFCNFLIGLQKLILVKSIFEIPFVAFAGCKTVNFQKLFHAIVLSGHMLEKKRQCVFYEKKQELF